MSTLSHLTARAQRTVETANAVHVLPILGLLLFPDPVHIVAGNFLVLGALERHEAHQLSHQRDFRVRVDIHGRRFGGWRRFSGRRFAFAGFFGCRRRIGGTVCCRYWGRGSWGSWSRRQVLMRRVFVRGSRWWRCLRRAFGGRVRDWVRSCGFGRLRSGSRASSCGRGFRASWGTWARAMTIGTAKGWIIYPV